MPRERPPPFNVRGETLSVCTESELAVLRALDAVPTALLWFLARESSEPMMTEIWMAELRRRGEHAT